ncbi:YidC/Oxa1 family membrane protein insertase [Patescibacteria group bacterium]
MNIGKYLLYQPLFNILVLLSFIFAGHLGIAIIVLTILIRLVLFPSFKKTLEISRAQQELQPKIEELRKEHKDNKQKQSEEMMKLFQENKVNPFSSCLPTIVQLIILISLYSVLREGISVEMFDEHLWSFIPRPEQIHTHFLMFDLTKNDLWILPTLAGGFQFLQSYLMMSRTKTKVTQSTQNALMKNMMYFFPIFTFIIARQFPAALALYWTVNTGFSAYQQYLVNHDLDILMRKNSAKPNKVKLAVKTKKTTKK